MGIPIRLNKIVRITQVLKETFYFKIKIPHHMYYVGNNY